MKIPLLAISISVLLSACAAKQIHSYNDALVNFYSTKAAASKPNVEDPVSYETALTSLENLAREAEEDADEEKDNINKISLYRIGATAAWQSEQTDDVFRIAEKGATLCAEEANANLAPRDCAMLNVIPLLAAIEENTRTYENLNGEITITTMELRETTHGQATVELFNSAEQGMIVFLDKRENTNPNVSDGYRQHIDNNIEIAASNFNDTYMLLRRAHNVDPEDNGADPTETGANCGVLLVRNTLTAQGLIAAANKLVPEDANAACP